MFRYHEKGKRITASGSAKAVTALDLSGVPTVAHERSGLPRLFWAAQASSRSFPNKATIA
jgi:hypothetical protein